MLSVRSCSQVHTPAGAGHWPQGLVTVNTGHSPLPSPGPHCASSLFLYFRQSLRPLFSDCFLFLFLMLPHNPCVAPKFPKVSLLGDDRPHAWAALGLPFTVLPCTPNAHKHPLSQLVNKLLFSEASFFFILENV